MSQVQALSHHLQPHSVEDYWEAIKAVRTLRTQASRWAILADDPEAAVEIHALLYEVERSLDPVLDVLELVIAGGPPDQGQRALL